MTTYLGPPALTNSFRKKICLYKDCHQPFNINENNIHIHDSHLLDVRDVQELVKKLHDRNQKNKEELGYIQNKLFDKIDKNENAIIALQQEDQTVILQNLSNLKEQSESLGIPLIERNNLESYDNIFFSTRRLRKFEKFEEPYNKNFKAMFNQLVNAQIFNQCQIKCPNHNTETITVFNLRQNIPKEQRLHCQYDQSEGAQNFGTCEGLLNKYSEQEKYFERLHQIKEFIFSLRFNIDRITNKILTEVQSLISKNFEYFENNQMDFYTKFKLGENIPKQTYENLAEFLSVKGRNLPLNGQQISSIDQFDNILNKMKETIVDIHTNFGNFLDNLKPSIIKITVETIIGQNAEIQHLEVQPNSNLQELFDYLKQDKNWNYQIIQAEIIIDHLKLNLQQRQPNQVILKNDNDIQIYFRQ